MDNFKSKLQDIATKGGAIPYVFGSMYEINRVLDKVVHDKPSYPLCIHIQSTEGVLLPFPASRREEVVTIGYADRLPNNYTDEQSEAMAAVLKEECLRMLGRCAEDGYFLPVDEAPFSVLPERSNDANLLIVLMTFQLREAFGACL